MVAGLRQELASRADTIHGLTEDNAALAARVSELRQRCEAVDALCAGAVAAAAASSAPPPAVVHAAAVAAAASGPHDAHTASSSLLAALQVAEGDRARLAAQVASLEHRLDAALAVGGHGGRPRSRRSSVESLGASSLGSLGGTVGGSVGATGAGGGGAGVGDAAEALSRAEARVAALEAELAAVQVRERRGTRCWGGGGCSTRGSATSSCTLCVREVAMVNALAAWLFAK